MSRITRAAMTEDDCRELAASLRPADRAELLAMGMDDTEQTVRNGRECSWESWTYRDSSGQLLACCGIAGDIGSYGLIPWMLGTDRLRRNARALIRLATPMLNRWLSLSPMLANYVHAKNKESRRWLAVMGFKEESTISIGNENFILFYRKRS